jgi:hypothetical protein
MNTEKHIDKSIEDLLCKIEQQCNDEPDTLLIVHPENYTTEHLFQLRGRWQKRNKEYKKMYRLIFALGALSPLFFAVGMSGFLFSPLLGVVFLPISVLFFIAFLIGIFMVSYRFKSYGYQESIISTIDKELKKRGQFI